MLTGFARSFKLLSSSRAGWAGVTSALASLLLVAGAGSVKDATAIGDSRTLSFHHTHSGEDLTVTFKRSGRYDEEALKQINHFLRDWRSQDQTTMDRRLFDILWEVYRDVDGKQPIQIISAYRSPATNAMLRRRSSGVARASQHMLGHAMDFFIPGVPLEQIRFAGLRLQRGGVGFYPTSGSPFVHLDTGSIRHWPRMNHDQLARVFPNGRTVHVPSDGRPLAGYELALADIERRGDGDDTSAKSKPSLFTSLFRGGKPSVVEDDEESGASAAPAKPSAVSLMTAALPVKSEPVPMPRAKPGRLLAGYQVASADGEMQAPVMERAQPPRPPMPVGNTDSRPQTGPQTGPQTPADIINARGFWDAMPAPKQATPAQVAAISARQALANATASADPNPTASIDASFQALAYAPPASSPVDRGNIVAASAPMPRSMRPTSVARNPMAVNAITTVVPKIGGNGLRAPGYAVSSRLASAATRDSSVWMRMMILAPSASSAMQTSVMGDPDMTLMRGYFVKPIAAVAITFGEDPQMGLTSESFSGAAVARLSTLSFVTRTAALR